MACEPDEDDHGPCCSRCGAEMERVDCWYGCDDGYFHDCGEDTCCCLDPEPNEPCPECHGRGSYWECPNVPHAKEVLP